MVTVDAVKAVINAVDAVRVDAVREGAVTDGAVRDDVVRDDAVTPLANVAPDNVPAGAITAFPEAAVNCP